MSCKIAISTVSKMILTKAKAGKSIANVTTIRSLPQQLFLEKGALKIYSKFTGVNPCQSVVSIKLTFGMGVLL